ncbi:MAG: 50S ribosomal protein L15 [Candidatus Daviesbacteria bacterium]|nr:50S ribosomal protein L15 [Candidatus Daviesbacteria bacterium]
MKLHTLEQTTIKSKRRIGRGIGSGRDKTAGRGYKGQKARGKVGLGFIGGTLPLYKKLPFKRGLGNTKKTKKMVPLALTRLAVFKTGSTVTLASLVEKKLLTKGQADQFGVKIMGDGEIKVALTIQLPATVSAKAKIEKAGGKVVCD